MKEVFLVIAGISSAIFLFQLAMLFMAGDIDFDGDVDLDLGDSDVAFSFISLKGIVAFFMGLGWGGLLTLQQGHVVGTSLLRGVLYGIAYMGLTALIYWGVKKLKQENTVDYYSLVGQKCTVYLRVPANAKGSGVVNVIINGGLTQVEALNYGDQEIPTGAQVTITEAFNDKLVVKS